MYSIFCVFLIHTIIFTLQHALFSHLLIHADLVYSFHVPNSIPLNDNSAVYLPTLQATDSRDISVASNATVNTLLPSSSHTHMVSLCVHLDSFTRTYKRQK